LASVENELISHCGYRARLGRAPKTVGELPQLETVDRLRTPSVGGIGKRLFGTDGSFFSQEQWKVEGKLESRRGYLRRQSYPAKTKSLWTIKMQKFVEFAFLKGETSDRNNTP